ncbi:MAG TPA: Holliday junction resolvase RuvX [Actinobacteria bacterium]|nr:Holliday junction resolvase RuvX [Actinomycetota bacterium]
MPSPASHHGSVLGLDLGQARIGVAVSDPERRLAVPTGTVRTGAPGDLKAIAALAREHGVNQVVVGHPVHLSGRKGEAAGQAETFAGVLRDVLQLPVDLQDERLSTVEATRGLAAAGVKGRERRAVVDQSAAVIILQAWLDAHRPRD